MPNCTRPATPDNSTTCLANLIGHGRGQRELTTDRRFAELDIDNEYAKYCNDPNATLYGFSDGSVTPPITTWGRMHGWYACAHQTEQS
jgi:hypothetical protein